MVSKVKSKYWMATHKFSIELPKSVEHAYRIDRKMQTTFWHDAIEKEMKRIREAMQEFNGDIIEARKRLIGYQQINCHMVFDVKMEGLARKARYVAGGHTTEIPKSLTYASVVTRESVRIGFLIAALNDLNVMAADIGNAYLNADCREKIYFIVGPEFGSKQGRILIIKKALYGLKSSGAAWRSLFSSTLHKLGYVPCRGDPDVYLCKAVNPSGHEYYEMLFVYVDDILHISHHNSIGENDTMKAIGDIYMLKDDSLKSPEVYLGANIGEIIDETGTKMTYMSATDYISGALKTVEAGLPENRKLNGHAERPFPQSYKPELDVTLFLDEDGIQLNQGYIGILRWIVKAVSTS
jgi:Reverse transcriptase (RNA-dependent DNA polymerase)